MDKEDAIVRDETRVTHYKSSRKALKSTLFGLFTLISTTTLFMLKSSQSSSHVSAVQAATDPLRYAPLDVDFVADFYSSVHSHGSDGLCVGMYGKSVSHSGYIGLKGDSTDSPKRSFFWLFEAQNEDPHAPVIVTTGGGPGTTGMMNPLIGQAHCTITSEGPVRNPNAWTERYNLLALDHPVGVGFSYGTLVNNSRDAAIDVYDFLQKFYKLFPKLAKNPLVLASGSYGGTYIPHTATVIHEENLAIEAGNGQPGAQYINLESMMVSNPYSDTLSHYRWALQQRCYYTDFFNSTMCAKFYELLPFCLEALQMAYQEPTTENRAQALHICSPIQAERVQGRSYENVEYKCDGSFEDCVPEGVWVSKFLNEPSTKASLGVPGHLNFSTLNSDVFQEFKNAGDLVQAPRLLYEPLLAAGIRLLHFIGKLDANCAWPGVISFLKLVQSSFQADFIAAPDLPWKGENATVRAIGQGAGNMTYILMNGAGHMVVKDQPALVKKIVDKWIENMPFEL